MTERTMDSREIAKLTDKNHADVCRDIRVMLEKLGNVGESRFASSYLSSQNKPVTCYKLPAHELMLLLTGYSVPLRDKVLRRWEELEKKEAEPAAIPGAKTFRLPNGVQLHELRVATEKGLLTRNQFAAALGLAPAPTEIVPIEKAGPEIAAAGFGEIRARFPPGLPAGAVAKAQRAAAAAVGQTLRAEEARAQADRLQPPLGVAR